MISRSSRRPKRWRLLHSLEGAQRELRGVREFLRWLRFNRDDLPPEWAGGMRRHYLKRARWLLRRIRELEEARGETGDLRGR